MKGSPEPSDADLNLRRASGARRAVLDAAATVVQRITGAAAEDPPEREPERVGVVFVHGIGSQPAGGTLLDWSGPIVRAVREWQIQHGQQLDPVRRAQIDFSGATIPVVRLAIPAYRETNAIGEVLHPAQEWVLSEAWWAAEIEPPSVKRLLRWLFGEREFTRIVTGVFTGLADSGQTGLWVRIEAVLVRTFVVFVAAALPLIYAVASLLRLLPINALRDWLATRQLDLLLTGWFGDLRVLVADRVQAANIRAKLAKTIWSLEALGCERVVLVAHSGGAIVSYMTLTDPLYSPDSGVEDVRFNADRLITLGQGLGLAWVLGHAFDGGEKVGDDYLAPGDHLMAQLAEHRRELDWIDFWATHDPAPSGPIGGTPKRPEPAVDLPDTSVPVVNRMSLRRDHFAYWDNDEQFVLPLLRLIETAGLPGEESRFYPVDEADVRARWRRRRVRALAEWWAALLLASGLVIAVGFVARVLGAHVLERLGTAVIDLVGVATNLTGVLRGVTLAPGPLATIRDALAGLIGAIPAVDLDVAAWLTLVGANIVGAAMIVILAWVLGRRVVSVWDDWDDDARVGARRDIPIPVAGTRFHLWARGTVASLVALAVAALAGAMADFGIVRFF